jgi:hypothetical protein
MVSEIDVPPAFRAASRPTFWVALALLALNDHVLKGAGVLPPELTGKLSDFAGLVVAPVVVAGVVGARSRRTRGLCLLAVGVGFSAINLFPFFAQAVERAIPWRITVDPTDLMALPALGAAWWLMAAPHERTRVALARIGIAVGALACMATSYADEGGSCTVDENCGGGWLCCEGVCIDPEWHQDHCGGCGMSCATGATCTEASCRLDAHGARSDFGARPALPEGVGITPPGASFTDELPLPATGQPIAH